MPLYDKSQEAHYNLISALQSGATRLGHGCGAVLAGAYAEWRRGSALYRKAPSLLRVRDVGLADPAALVQTLAAWETYERLGSPEGELAIVQAVIYLATAPKSNAAYRPPAVRGVPRDTGSLMPPKHILNAPTKLMQDLGYGDGYAYDHDDADGFSGQNYFPDEMPRQRFYHPVERGFERDIGKRLEYWDKLRRSKSKD